MSGAAAIIGNGARTLPPRKRAGGQHPCIVLLRVSLLAAAAAGLAGVPADAAPSPSRNATGRAARADRAAVEAARHFLCPNGGSPVRGGRCRGGGAVAAADPSVRGWDAGLPAAGRRQTPCPEGTAAARPLFWDGAVRCVPR